LLEFLALVVLRIREPDLQRPFKVPGGMLGAIGVGVMPTLLLAFSITRGEHEQVLGMSDVRFGGLLVVAGFVAYGITIALRARHKAG
jgi:amino acid transporter